MRPPDPEERHRSAAGARAAGDGRGGRLPEAPLSVARARLVAADLLSRRPWTRAELTRRLRHRGASPEVAAEVVGDLTERGHLDDAAFARHWVQTRAARGYGPARLRAELAARGVASRLVTAALSELTTPGPLDAARAVARRRVEALRGVDPRRAAARLRDHLLRRGFPAGVVSRVVREALTVE